MCFLRPRILALFLLLLMGISPGRGVSQEAGGPADLTTRPNPKGEPTRVAVRMIVLDIGEVRGADQSFSANVALQVRWQDPRLRHEGAGHRKMSLDDIWHPRFQFLNRRSLQSTFDDEASVSPEGEVRWIQRLLGQFSQPLQLKDFPFDSQDLEFTLVAAGHVPGAIELVEDPDQPSRIGDSFTVSDWEMGDWEVEIAEASILEGERPVPTFRMILRMHRNSQYHLVNVILPLVLIICMSWIVFWIPSAQLGPRVSVSVTAMLTLTAYRFAIGSSLPKISYLTRLDWFILCASLLIFLSLVEVVVTSWLVDRDRATLARRINHAMRGLAPGLLVVIAWITLG